MLNLTSHERDVIALVLREHADEMDHYANDRQTVHMVPDEPWQRIMQSNLTAELREIAHKVEWEG